MSIPYPKKERAGPSPVGRLGLHIYRDPPAAKYTRKYEPVNVADVMYMNRPDSENGDPTRINEGIRYYALQKNPMVAVDYGAGQGIKNPYRIEVVRPPITTQAQQHGSISRPDVHQNYAIQSNPRIEPLSIGNQVDRTAIDNPIRKDTMNGIIQTTPSISYYEMIDALSRDASGKVRSDEDIIRGSIRPTSSYAFDPSRETNFIRSTAIGDANVYTVTSNIGINGQTTNPYDMSSDISSSALQDLRTFGVTSNAKFGNIIVFDPKTNATLDLNSTVKDKHYIAVNAAHGKPLIFNTNDGKQISLKDYSYSVVNTAIGNPQLIIQVNQPELVLERNTPLFTASSNVRGLGDSDPLRMGSGTIVMDYNVPLTSVTASVSSSIGDTGDVQRTGQDQYHMNKQASFGSFERNGRVDHSMRQSFQTGLEKKQKFNDIKKLGHQMNLAR